MSDNKNLEQELRRLADEVRVKIHLAGMEAKEAWGKLEPKLREFETKAEQAAGRIEAELSEVGQQLKSQLDRLKEKLSSD